MIPEGGSRVEMSQADVVLGICTEDRRNCSQYTAVQVSGLERKAPEVKNTRASCAAGCHAAHRQPPHGGLEAG